MCGCGTRGYAISHHRRRRCKRSQSASILRAQQPQRRSLVCRAVHRDMSEEKKGTPVEHSFVCEREASQLLNCLAASEYVEQKCISYMKKLRKCIVKERVVKFDLLPDDTAQPDDTPQKSA
eukprot:TRINITY_DN19721_c0_g1_i1.p2 TRINITY_DN19721_c0_g1~~TRINITY_DN19721_c0_g1_i1.p2  ORF type:complete len:130 (-),score=4.58 TRINITY_DN19721_c0_g1_i1:591-953(-)